MTKLLVVIYALEKGGAEKLLVTILPHFKARQIHVQLLLLNSSKSVPEFISIIKNSGIDIHDLGIDNMYHPLSLIKIRKFLKANLFDIVHVHLFHGLYWIAAASFLLPKKPKLVYTEHSNHNKRRDSFFLRPIEKLVYSGYDRIIAITEEVKKNLNQWAGLEKKLITIMNGIDIKMIHNAPLIKRHILLDQLNIPQNSHLLFMAASFRYPKDQITLIKACVQLGTQYHLLLAGEGDLIVDCKKLSNDLGISSQIHFLGFRNDIASLMKSVDVNILSSYYEGMSGVTLESLASGIPFLGSDVSGIQDIVPSNQFLFEKANPSDLAHKVQHLLQDPIEYLKISKQGLNFVENFDIENMIDKHISLYSSLLIGQS